MIVLFKNWSSCIAPFLFTVKNTTAGSGMILESRTSTAFRVLNITTDELYILLLIVTTYVIFMAFEYRSTFVVHFHTENNS